MNMNIIDDWLERNGDKEVKKQVKLILSGDTQQRKTLKAYAELIQKNYTHHFFDDAVEESINEFLNL
jgi:ATP-dependent exoDNAse (exonuclease V) alpha subunit